MKETFEDETGLLPKLELEAQKEQLSTEYQRHILNVDWFYVAIFQMFCGYRKVGSRRTKNTIGIVSEGVATTFTIDRKARIMNEAGGSYLHSNFFPLITPVAQTSNLRDDEIYNMWHGKLFTTRLVLARSYLDPRNPYQFDITHLEDVITTLLDLKIITIKSRDGFALKQSTETLVTSTINRIGLGDNQHKEGLVSGMAKRIGLVG